MKRIAYLLHRFPAITDTFIKREIRSLQKMGTQVFVISVWTPSERETTPSILSQWSGDTHFVLPRSPFAIAGIICASLARSPARFLATFYQAIATARPGVRGFFYQLFYFVEAVLAAEILRQAGADHIHNHNGDQSGTVTVLAAGLSGLGYSITFHGWPVFFDAKESRIKEKVLGARFTRSISYFCRSQLMMFSGSTDPTQFKVVHCGINPARYDYRPPRREVKRLFCAARLSSEKGLAVILQALKRLLDEGRDLELELAGDGPCREELKALAEELGICARARFLGSLSEEDVARRLQEADLFVLSSFVEGVPVSAMEAMAAGVPVIATNIAGTSELIEDGKTGLLVRPSDPQVLADAIVRMMEDYSFRLRVAELAREKVTTEFDVEKEAEKLNAYLLESCP